MDNIVKVVETVEVLIVDDMEAIRSLVTGCVKELGINYYQVATNGDAAWKVLNTSSIDMIICDWDMPELSGLELLKLVRASDEHKHIPFLMLTATMDKQSVLKAVEAGVTDYLSKPFQPNELEYRIIKMLRKLKH